MIYPASDPEVNLLQVLFLGSLTVSSTYTCSFQIEVFSASLAACSLFHNFLTNCLMDCNELFNQHL